MIRILLVAGAALLTGGVLAAGVGASPVRPGLIGLLLTIAGAVLVRRRWSRLRALGTEPGSPERALWHALASTALLGGFIFTSLWRVGLAMELHTPFVHAFAIDTWTMILGTAISYRIARDPEPRRDERDDQFAAAGVRAGYNCAGALCIGLSLLLAYGDHTPLERLSRAMIAHLLISIVMIAMLTQYAVQLRLYWADHRRAALPA